MAKRVQKVETEASAPSTVPYKQFRCPNKGCKRVESGGHAPFYSTCPDCFQPAGAFVPVEAKKGK